MTDFAPSIDHCHQAFETVTARLPSGFVADGGLFPLWVDAVRDGRAGDRKVQVTLEALLPASDRWPVLDPVCSRMSIDETPQSIFLRTLTSEAYRIGRRARQAVTAAALPLRRLSAMDDGRTAPEHMALHGTIRPIGDPFWVRFDASPWWGCRCESSTMNARTAERRGYRPS